MIGDKLLIEPYHTARAAEICRLLTSRLQDKYVITVGGESGSGKSELAAELARLLFAAGAQTGIVQQDDYFVFPPQTNHEMRRRNLEQVGTYEVKLDFLDANLRSFKRDENPIFKPLVIYDEDRITTEELDTHSWQVLIAEGTYTTRLQFADFHIFIARDYRQTQADRRRRARDRFDSFLQEVLEREHRIISRHLELADLVIPADFGSVELRVK
ncbi:MAG TPA: hypothetical protein ENI60_03740 [Candidatus Fraserbacteria bacterium]|nr:hypothetical protein [Candidatus Fraserbacteria bacterium]